MASDSVMKVVAEMREWDYTNGNPDSGDVSEWADRLAAQCLRIYCGLALIVVGAIGLALCLTGVIKP